MTNTLRHPRAIVRLNGAAVPGWTSWSVSNNSYFEADTFSVDFAASRLPAANNAAWFSQQTEIFVEILAGFPANPAAPTAAELTSLIYGRVDSIEFNPVTTTLSLTGRDLTAAFIDTKFTATYPDRRAFQVVEQLAASHGLTCLATVTSGFIGSLMHGQQVRMQATQSEWDFICWMAREYGYVVYVQGQSMYFGPDERLGADPYVITWTPPTPKSNAPTSNVHSLNLSRAMTVAKGITVTVRSPQHLKKTAVVQSYPANPKAIAAGKSSPFGSTQTYYYNVEPNLTPTQCETRAEFLYNQIISHAMKLEADLPADLAMDISVPIQLTGTGTVFDQTYYPRLITRSMNDDDGFLMSVEAQNTTPELEGAAGDS